MRRKTSLESPKSCSLFAKQVAASIALTSNTTLRPPPSLSFIINCGVAMREVSLCLYVYCRSRLDVLVYDGTLFLNKAPHG